MNEEEKFYVDILKEVCSLGAGNAAASLSRLIGKKVKIDLPEIVFKKPEEGKYFMPKGEKELIIGSETAFGREKEREGVIFVMFPPEHGLKLLKYVLGYDTEEIGDIEKSALIEVCNILSGALIGSIANFTGMKIIGKPPQYSYESPELIIQGGIGEQLKTMGRIFFTVVNIEVEDERIFLTLLFFPFFNLAEEIWRKNVGR